MIKAIFVDPKRISGIKESGANYLMVMGENLNQSNWQSLKKIGMKLSIAFVAFDRGGCPANPDSRKKLLGRVKYYLDFQPEEIWLDHFRFDGHWEDTRNNKVPDVHQHCQYCQGKNRLSIMSDLAKSVIAFVNGRSKVGYFAVPFKPEEIPQLREVLGQDHSLIGKIFDMSSPMLYHRMIKKPPSYISSYIKWIFKETGKPTLPIIQIKDMPDELEDTLMEVEITKAFNEAKKSPSFGVAFFWWTQVFEKNKSSIIKKLFSTI